MALVEYQKKRNADKTPEPFESASSGDGVYVIQEHHASHLHWDLRLGMDGVLKSWAVPKEPPQEVGVKRLAVMTEDHPVGYESFEGTIPEGNYGAGTVKIWDWGTYDLLDRKEDKLIIDIHGKRLTGRHVLVRLKKPGNERNWLFFKSKI